MSPERILANGCRLRCGRIDSGPDYGTVRRHGSADVLLIITVAGAGRVRGLQTDGRIRTLALEVGSLVRFRPGIFQDYATDPAVGRWVLLWAHVLPPPHWTPWLDLPEPVPGIGLLAPDSGGRGQDPVRRGFRRCLRLAGGLHPQREDLALNALEAALIQASGLQSGDRRPVDPLIERLCGRLASGPVRAMPIRALAQSVGLSPSRLMHRFKAATGTSLRAWWEAHRLERARHLLASSALPVAEVAERCGFADPFHFSRRFRHHTGAAPSAVRSGAAVTPPGPPAR